MTEERRRRWRVWPSRRRLVIYGVLFTLLGGTVTFWFGCAARRRAEHVLPPDHVVDEALATRLLAHVEELAVTIGARHPWAPDGLERARQYVTRELERPGHTVRALPFGTDAGTEAWNLEVELPAERPDNGVLVIGAHYDSEPSEHTPGADDNATGVALLIELARALAGETLGRPVRLVAFACEEPPHFQTQRMGSLAYARRLRAREVPIWGMISLESLGYFRNEPGTQEYPALLGAFYPDRGNFVAVVGNVGSRWLVRRVTDLLIEHSVLPVEQGSLHGDLPGVGWSDHWSFWQIDVPAIMLTDTAPFRNPHYHRSSDTPDTLHRGALAALGEALPQVVRELAR